MAVSVVGVAFEHHREPFGIGEVRPRVSWRVAADGAAADKPGWLQAAYEIEVSAAGGGRPWSSGRVESAESVLVEWEAPALRSRDRRIVRVRVWGAGDEEPSAWSEPAIVEAGLLAHSDWSAELIGPDRELGDRLDRPPVLFRRAFELRGEIDRARLYVTAHGVYAAEMNGQRIGDHVLAPGWTSYRHRLRYQTFDVTSLLVAGPNVLGATVAEGWYAGHLGFHGGRRRIWGDDVAFLAQLEVRYADGQVETVATDGDWRWANGPTTSAGIYAGETCDARLERPGWSAPGFDVRAGGEWARRLAAPNRRGPGSGRARVPPDPGRTTARRGTHSRLGRARNSVRSGRGVMGSKGRPAGGGLGRSGRSDGHGSLARSGLDGDRGGTGPASLLLPVPARGGRPGAATGAAAPGPSTRGRIGALRGVGRGWLACHSVGAACRSALGSERARSEPIG